MITIRSGSSSHNSSLFRLRSSASRSSHDLSGFGSLLRSHSSISPKLKVEGKSSQTGLTTDLLRQHDKQNDPSKQASERLNDVQQQFQKTKAANRHSLDPKAESISRFMSSRSFSSRSKFSTNSLSKISTGADSHVTHSSNSGRFKIYLDRQNGNKELSHDNYKKRKMFKDLGSIRRGQEKQKTLRAQDRQWKDHFHKEGKKGRRVLEAKEELDAEQEKHDAALDNHELNKKTGRGRIVDWVLRSPHHQPESPATP